MSTAIRAAGVVAIVGVLAAWASAGEAENTFKALYGKELKKVRATPDKADDLALAQRLVQGARKAAGQPALLTLMCKAACDLAARPRGWDTAIEAMELLGKNVPPERLKCLLRVVDLRKRAYDTTRGLERLGAAESFVEACLSVAASRIKEEDFIGARRLCGRAKPVARQIQSGRIADIEATIREAIGREKVARAMKDLRARLKANSRNKVARDRLVRLALIEMDDPARAEGLCNADVDEALRSQVRLAAAKPQTNSEAACLELAEWYAGLTQDKTKYAHTKAAMLKRAIRYYDVFLKRFQGADLLRTRAQLGKAKAEDTLAALALPGGGIDLLRLPDLAKHAYGYEGAKPWKRTAKGLLSPKGGHQRIDIPLSPRGAYELDVRFVVAKKDWGNLVVLFPGGGAFNTGVTMTRKEVILDIGDQKKRRTLGTVKHAGLAFDEEHRLRVRAWPRKDQITILVYLNGKYLLAWKGLQRELGTNCLSWRLEDPTGLGLAAHGTQCTFRSATLRMLSGKAVPLKLKGNK